MNWFKLECTTRAFVTALQLTVRYEMSVIIIIIIIIIIINENFISPFFRPPGATNPQKERRHIRNQSRPTPACKIWLELARRLSRNSWQKSEQKNNRVKLIPRPSVINPAEPNLWLIFGLTGFCREFQLSAKLRLEL